MLLAFMFQVLIIDQLFMMIPVRYLVQRKMKPYTEKHILFSLSVVHAQARI